MHSSYNTSRLSNIIRVMHWMHESVTILFNCQLGHNTRLGMRHNWPCNLRIYTHPNTCGWVLEPCIEHMSECRLLEFNLQRGGVHELTTLNYMGNWATKQPWLCGTHELPTVDYVDRLSFETPIVSHPLIVQKPSKLQPLKDQQGIQALNSWLNH